MFMGRSSGLTLGLLGIILPGYLLYVKVKLLGGIESITGQGFLYRLVYSITQKKTTLNWISGDWLKPQHWGGNTELYIFLASFGLAVLGFLVFLGNSKGGAYLLILAGLANLGLLLLRYSNIEEIFQLPGATGYPIPVGAIFLLLAGLLGSRD